MEGIKMKKILKYSTIVGAAAAMLSYSVATADTGGYVRVKNLDSHWHSLPGGPVPSCMRGLHEEQEEEQQQQQQTSSHSAGKRSSEERPGVGFSPTPWRRTAPGLSPR